MKGILVIITVALVILASAACAEDWVILPGYSTLDITFRLVNGQLYLSNGYVLGEAQGGELYYDYWSENLHHTGDWGVVGSIMDGKLVPDPYARFIDNDSLWGVYLTHPVGYIAWDPSTPIGYNATLLLGAVYSSNDGVTINSISNTTLYSERTDHFYYSDGTNREVTSYTTLSHSFTATSDGTGYIIPEPSSLAALAIGFLPLGVLVRRRRRQVM